VHIELRVKGPIGPAVAGLFDDLDVQTETVLTGDPVDDGSLHGLPARVRDFGLEVVDPRVTGPA
jgi:hypothetical protein